MCQVIGRMIGDALAKASLRMYPRRAVRGVPVIFTDLEIQREDALRRLGRALEIVAATDPRRLKWVLTYVKRFVVWPGHYTAADRFGGVQVSSEHMGWMTDVQLASVLVHEATHQRIAARIPSGERDRERTEIRCLKEQIAFLRSIPGEGVEVAQALEAALDDRPLTDPSNEKALLELAANGGIPRWMVPFLVRRH